MANTRQSAKRARQADRRQNRNNTIRNATRTTLKKALVAIQKKDIEAAKAAYMDAVKALSKAASKHAIPSGRAARKVSRLTLLAKKTLPEILPFLSAQGKAPKASKAKTAN